VDKIVKRVEKKFRNWFFCDFNDQIMKRISFRLWLTKTSFVTAQVSGDSELLINSRKVNPNIRNHKKLWLFLNYKPGSLKTYAQKP